MGNRDVSIVFKANDKLSESVKGMRGSVNGLRADVESFKKIKDEASASIERSFKRKLAFSCAPSTVCQQSVTLPVRHRVSPSMASSQVSSCVSEVRPPMGAFSDVSVPASVPTHSGSRRAAR